MSVVEFEEEETRFSTSLAQAEASIVHHRVLSPVSRGGGSEDPLIVEVSDGFVSSTASSSHMDAPVIEEILCDALPGDAVEQMNGEAGFSRHVSLPHVSLPSEWLALPSECKQFSVYLGGELMHVVKTCGDGACSMHSLWGVPSPSRDGEGELELFLQDVRDKLFSQIPHRWSDVCALYGGQMQTYLEAWVNEKCFG